MAEKFDRILVIDDDEMARESYSEILSMEGYTVKSADSAEKAIEIMKMWPVHLFLIDIMLPKMTGIELLNKLDVMNHLYEAIIVTAYGDMDTAKEAMELGAFSYVSKPVEYKNLAPLVKKALEIAKQKKVKLDYLDKLEKKVEDKTKKLEKEIAEKGLIEEALRENERKLTEQNIMLLEKNIALREVMNQLEAEKGRLGKQINTNVDRLLIPLVKKLRSKGSDLDKTYIDLLEGNINEITSQFGNKISDRMLKLTQKEIELCNLIKGGLSSKEIAGMLNISPRTVETHRNNIRKKLGIGKQEVNLVTYLKSIA